MKKLLLILTFCCPLFCIAQNKVEEVRLSNGKTAVLYDNGLWIYKDSAPTKTATSSDTQTLISNPKPAANKGTSSSASAPCGAPTKTTGAPCRRMVKGGGRCYQHS